MFRIPNMVKLQLLCFLFLFFIFFIICTGRTGQSISTHHASNDAVSPNEMPFGVTLTTNYIVGSIFPPKIPKIPIGLAASLKTQERFRAYLHEASTDKH
jgi:hypothetical protein